MIYYMIRPQGVSVQDGILGYHSHFVGYLLLSGILGYPCGLCEPNYPLIEKVWLNISVWDVTWMSDQCVHLAKWIPAPEQVTVMHSVKWPHQVTWSISYFDWRHLSKWHASALSQVISHNVYGYLHARVHFFIPPSQRAFLISVIIRY